MKQSARSCKKIVVKIGSSLLCDRGGLLEEARVGAIAAQIAQLKSEGREAVIVSSGAIALGMSVLGLKSRPKELAYLQAAAAVGQHELMSVYRSRFRKEGLTCAQILLTWEDIDDRARFLNAKHTLGALLKLGVVPVINENDTVSTDEIKFGDNDKLSALVATLTGADLVLILSDVDGLLDTEKNVVRLVDEITPAVRALACPTTRTTCVGGMVTKIDAARIAVDSGIPCVIASGCRAGIITAVARDLYSAGTLFVPRKDPLQGHHRWMAFSARPRGAVVVDEGARRALLAKKSLLAVGVTGVSGVFPAGAIIGVKDAAGREFARGKTRLASAGIDDIKGNRFPKEVIHRDDIVILAGEK